MSGIVGSRLNIRGSGVVGKLGTDGQVLTSSGAGASAVFEAAGGGAVSALNSATESELVTVGSTTTELDAEANLTYDGTTLLLSQATPVLKILPTTNGNSGKIELCGRSTDGTPTENRVQIIATPEGSTANTKLLIHVEDSGGVDAKVEITSGGDLIVKEGNLNISTTGKGIDFDSSSTSAILDDYEEGTFTPDLNYAGTTTGVTHEQQNGVNTKIGNRVFIRGTVRVDAKGSGTGHARFSGLPITALNAGWDEHPIAFEFDNTVDAWGMAGLVNTTHIALFYYPDAGTGRTAAYKAQWGDDFECFFCGNYQASA